MNRPASPRSPAFTLVELLVVIAIIAILASILLPVLGRVQESANSTKCAANLRQIGTAINAYTVDSDGLLPGPLDTWQNPFSPPIAASSIPDAGSAETDAADRQLTRRLAKYIPTPANSTPNERTSIFVCPSFARVVPKLDAPAYVLNPRPITALDTPPFGDPSKSKNPVRKSMLSNWTETADGTTDKPVDLSRTWALKDADAQAFTNVTYQAAPPATASLPKTPVHKDHRNALFYDWHVARLDADLARNDVPK